MISWDRVKQHVQAIAASLVNYTATTTCQGNGDDQVQGRAVGPGEPNYALQVRRLWPFGIRSVPPNGCEAIIVRVNAGRRSIALIAAESQNFGRTDMAVGESQHYNSVAGCEVYLDKNGQNNINAADGQQVNIQGGTAAQNIARNGDPAGYICVTTVMGVVTAVAWSKTPLPAPVVCTPIYITGGSSKAVCG